MHLSDGVLNPTTVAITYTAATACIGYSLIGIEEEEIPKISLMTAAFFVLGMLSIPIGPSSTHPLLIGILGITLGRRAPLAIFTGLVLQALLFQHGGLTSLGANLLIVAIPALLCWKIYLYLYEKKVRQSLLGLLCGGLGVFFCVTLLIMLLSVTHEMFFQGEVSVARLLILSHIPLMVIEAVLTGSTVEFLARVKPEILKG